MSREVGKPMHVFLLISSLTAGGAERAMSELAACLAEAGWRVTLATLTDSTECDRYPIHAHVQRVCLGNPPPAKSIVGKLLANWRRVQKLRAVLRELQPDAMLSFMEATNVLAILAAGPLKLPVVVAERTDPSQHLHNVPPMWRWGRRAFYRRAHTVVAQTSGAASWLRTECHCTVEVIPNALRRLPDPVATRQDWIVSAGRLEPVKGYDIVMSAFARVCAGAPGWRLIIAGEGRLNESLRQLAADLGIDGRTDFVGHRADIERLLEQAAVVALASRYEGFPNVLLESLGMGAAVIATDCKSGPAELISNEENGLLVPVDDVDAMADRMARLIANAGLRRRLGTRALEARSTYAQSIVARRWITLIEAAVSRAHG